MIHPAKALWAIHHPPAGYPEGVLPVPEPIPGRAFFPGGYGQWMEDGEAKLADFPAGGIMILGHDFHSVTGYEKSRCLGYEPLTQKTWGNLRKLLDAAGLPLHRCFFTNLYMGLRVGSATGVFPGAGDEAFVRHCKSFLLHQIAVQRPTLLLTLGIHVPVAIGGLSPELKPWAEGRGLKHLDTVGPVRTGVSFLGVEGFATTTVALIHPSLRHASLRHRRFEGAIGAEAELAMLRRGMALSTER